MHKLIVNGLGSDFLPKQNGNMPQEEVLKIYYFHGVTTHIFLLMLILGMVRFPTKIQRKINLSFWLPLEVILQTNLDYTTYLEMYGNGVTTGILLIITNFSNMKLRTILEGHKQVMIQMSPTFQKK